MGGDPGGGGGGGGGGDGGDMSPPIFLMGSNRLTITVGCVLFPLTPNLVTHSIMTGLRKKKKKCLHQHKV